MTLIVAWKCSDGVVVGADSAATLGAMGQETVSELVSKLFIVRESLILGVSGPISLGQRYDGELRNIPNLQSWAKMQSHKVSTTISEHLWKYAKVEYERAQTVAEAVGHRVPTLNAVHHTVVAIRASGTDRLFQFTETCAPEEATDDLPYVSIGSGQLNADPFLAFLRDVFWAGTTPNLAGGIFATYWTLIETIRKSPGKVSEPIEIAILQNGKAGILGEAEIEEHAEAMKEARKALHDFRKDLEPEE